MADGLLPRGVAEETRRLNRSPKMNCRIDRVVSGENRVVLLISGRITGQFVDIIRDVLQQEAGTPVIDLGNVSLVDREAVRFLAVTGGNGTELRNCPAYIREWVTKERAETEASEDA
jgi:hypothetical protein